MGYPVSCHFRIVADFSAPGAVSGPKGCLVMIQDALKKPWPNVPPPPKPAAVGGEKEETVPAEH